MFQQSKAATGLINAQGHPEAHSSEPIRQSRAQRMNYNGGAVLNLFELTETPSKVSTMRVTLAASQNRVYTNWLIGPGFVALSME